MATRFMKGQAQKQTHFALQQQQVESVKSQQQKREAEMEYERAVKEQEQTATQRRLIQHLLAEKAINAQLQGLNAVGNILNNVSATSAIMLGFCGQLITQMDTKHIDLVNVKYLLWMLAITTMALMLHSIFVSTITYSNGVNLAYEGKRGLEDVKRALRGMLDMRSDVCFNFLLGFICFSACVVIVIWIKLDQDAPHGLVLKDEWVGVVCTIIWIVALVRMAQAYRRMTNAFVVLGVEGYGSGDGLSDIDPPDTDTGTRVKKRVRVWLAADSFEESEPLINKCI